jgi:hypothetical protein
MTWHTPESRKRVGSPSYGEISYSCANLCGMCITHGKPICCLQLFLCKIEHGCNNVVHGMLFQIFTSLEDSHPRTDNTTEN